MGFIVKGIGKVVKAVVGVAAKVVNAIVGPVVGLFKPKTPKASANLRLSKDLTPEAYRKIVFGLTASGLDLRFWEVWGPKGTNYDEVIALATHRIYSARALFLESELAINDAGVVQSNYSGVLSRTVHLGGINTPPLAVGSGTQWNGSSSFRGVAHMKLAWVPTEKKLPNGVPSRYTQIVEGAPVYDPRRDSTAGGSGNHRINDRDTWEYIPLDANGVPIGRNNALQMLWYLLGWYIPNKQTGEQILVAGRGVDPSDINLSVWITAANNAEAARYYTDMILSTEDEHTANEDKISASGLIGQLVDTGGLWAYYMNVDDTANIALELTDKDVIQGGQVTWAEYRGISDQYQQVSGKFIDPSANALFQLNGYPMVRDANYEALTGLKRRKTFDFEVVQDVLLAQKLARLLLNMGQYQAEFAAPFNYRALKAQAWSIVRYTSERFGWTKLFRVYRYDITGDEGGIAMLLREIHPSIWTAGSVVQPVAPSAGKLYDPRQEIPLSGLGWQVATVTNGAGVTQDAVIFFWNEPPANVRYTEIRYRAIGSAYWLTAAPAKGDNFVLVSPINSGTQYELQGRHVSIHEVPGPWVPEPAQKFTAGTNSQLPWDSVSDPKGTRPQNGATVGAPGNTPVGDTTANLVVTTLNNVNLSLADELIRGAGMRGLFDFRTLMANGEGINTYVGREVTQLKTSIGAVAATLELLGAANADGTAFVIDLTKAEVKPGETIAQRFTSINAELYGAPGERGLTASVDQLNEAVYDTSGNGTAKALTKLTVDGYVSGFTQTNDGKESAAIFLVDRFGVVDPNGGSPLTVFEIINGEVYAPNLTVGRLRYSALELLLGGDQNNLDPTSGYQILPGGLIINFGKVRGRISGEATFNVAFEKPFPGACTSVVGIPWIANYNRTADLWIQQVGEPSQTGAVFCTQGEDGGYVDGFNWIAFGY